MKSPSQKNREANISLQRDTLVRAIGLTRMTLEEIISDLKRKGFESDQLDRAVENKVNIMIQS